MTTMLRAGRPDSYICRPLVSVVEELVMRLLVLLFALLSMPVLAADQQLAQSPQQLEMRRQQQLEQEEQLRQYNMQQRRQQEENRPSQNEKGKYPNATTQRHPGDYCCRHCRDGELPCGRGCMAKGGKQVCLEKKTCSCSGKP